MDDYKPFDIPRPPKDKETTRFPPMTDRTPEEYRKEAWDLARHISLSAHIPYDEGISAIAKWLAQREQERARRCTVCGAAVVLVCAACKTVAAPLPDDWKAELVTAASAKYDGSRSITPDERAAAEAYLQHCSASFKKFGDAAQLHWSGGDAIFRLADFAANWLAQRDR